jgi:hypothetical protein
MTRRRNSRKPAKASHAAGHSALDRQGDQVDRRPGDQVVDLDQVGRQGDRAGDRQAGRAGP